MKIPKLRLSLSEERKITLEKKTNTSSMEALKFKILPLPSAPLNGMAVDSHFISTDLAPIKTSSPCHPQGTQAPSYQMNSPLAIDRRGPQDGLPILQTRKQRFRGDSYWSHQSGGSGFIETVGPLADPPPLSSDYSYQDKIQSLAFSLNIL